MRTTTCIGMVWIGSLTLAGCAAAGPGGGDPAPAASTPAEIRVESEPADAAMVGTVRRDATGGAERLESFFGHRFGGPVTIRLMPSREAFDAYAQANWGFPKTQCWMVGAGETDGLVLLSPRVWGTEACDHDPDDAEELRRLIAHELCHTIHMRVNPSDEFEGVTTLDWFVEGVAVYASGQLDRARKDSAAGALKRGEGPERLADAWTGPDRYGNAGSMVAVIDKRWGRQTLTALLGATSQDELLNTLGVSEDEFLKLWRDAAPW